jgi:Ca2+/Na+ antiporter
MPLIKGNNKGDKEKNKKDEEKDVIKLVLVVLISGLFLIGISILFIKDPELHYIIRGLGISIIGGALIAWAIGHLGNRSFNFKT